jgi:hypothetical protein
VGGTCSIHVNTINSYKRLVGKSAWTYSHTLADNIKVNGNKILWEFPEWDCRDWRLTKTIKNIS